MSKGKNKAPKKGGTGWGFNAVIVIVIAAVLGLGIYAVASEYIKNHPQEEKTETVADFIKDKKLTLDEFKTEYGLEEAEISKDDAIETVSMDMTLENYAKYADSTLDDLKAEYKLGDDVSADMKWQEAIDFMPTGVVAESFFGSDFDTFKSQMGLTDEITADTLWSETNTIMNAVYAEQQAQSEAEETNTDEAGEETADDSEDADNE